MNVWITATKGCASVLGIKVSGFIIQRLSVYLSNQCLALSRWPGDLWVYLHPFIIVSILNVLMGGTGYVWLIMSTKKKWYVDIIGVFVI
jgi:hypothetical protein